MSFGVIFDMDGVLVMTEDAHWQSWRTAAAPRGVDVSHELFLSCFGRINPDCVRIIFGEGIPPDESSRIADEKERAFRDIIRSAVPIAPGVLPLLQGLRDAGAAIAVGSSAPPENVDLVLDAGQIRPFFSAAVNGSQVARGKPAPDVFLRAAELLGLPPARCLVIEDAPAGIRAARAAGMIAVGVATTHPAAQLSEAGAHRVEPDLTTLSADVLRAMIP
ncbi:MAG: HAD family phosphatase [Phycisphaerales bacterium]|nr:HAD family phosphatase [Phycisphaerales bacterium]